MCPGDLREPSTQFGSGMSQGEETWTDICPGTCDSHLAHLLYFSQMTPAWGPLPGQAGPAPNGVNALTEARVSLLLGLGGLPGDLPLSNAVW